MKDSNLPDERKIVETNDYFLIVGLDTVTEDLEYHLVNRLTGVVEGVGTQLPSAMMAVHQMQAELNKVRPDPAGELRRREAAAKRNPFLELAGGSDPDFSLN